jgi:hypothetical protein
VRDRSEGFSSAAIEEWAEGQPDAPSLSEAIRRLVEIALARKVYPGSTDETITQAAEANLGGAKAAKSMWAPRIKSIWPR